MKHEEYIQTIGKQAITKIAEFSSHHSRILSRAKLCYGVGDGRYRGITYYSRWIDGGETCDLLEVAATGEESAVQLAGTTIHELGHVLAGPLAGHDKEWKLACELLGLRDAQATGHVYTLDGFDTDIRDLITALVAPKDGQPTFRVPLIGMPGIAIGKMGACPLGIGTRGGKTRGTGSGSRLRLYTCECGTKVRVASDSFDATCNVCAVSFKQVVKN